MHDAARALTPESVFHRVADALAAGAAAVIPAIPVVDTVKTVAATTGEDSALAPEIVTGTAPREDLRAVQTPQGFRLRHPPEGARGGRRAWTSSRRRPSRTTPCSWNCSASQVHAVRGSTPVPENHHAPGPDPRRRAPGGPAGRPLGGRLSMATDNDDPAAHRNRPGCPRLTPPQDSPRPLWLGGLLWEGERGLAGHSDGDPVAHAAADALFSAAGIGDLGTHFGTDRPEFAGASGVTLLAEAARIVRAAGFEIGNVAVQFVANRPKFGPRREESQRRPERGRRRPGQRHGHHQRRAGVHRPGRGHLGRRHRAGVSPDGNAATLRLIWSGDPALLRHSIRRSPRLRPPRSGQGEPVLLRRHGAGHAACGPHPFRHRL